MITFVLFYILWPELIALQCRCKQSPLLSGSQLYVCISLLLWSLPPTPSILSLWSVVFISRIPFPLINFKVSSSLLNSLSCLFVKCINHNYFKVCCLNASIRISSGSIAIVWCFFFFFFCSWFQSYGLSLDVPGKHIDCVYLWDTVFGKIVEAIETDPEAILLASGTKLETDST